MNTNEALSVTQLNSYIKALMEGDDFLRSVCIRGEISNFKRHTSGHLYFTLKDGASEISAVMFRSAADRLSFMPKSGLNVTVWGRVSVYELSGKYQIYVTAMTDSGAGALFEQYKRLLEKLRAEGLFDAERKKAIPRFPKKVGIVTSPTGAAIRDMINVTGRRFPSAQLLISPALVQGAGAPEDLCRALALIDTIGECDVIIIGRGGGSIEDLWAFNDEALVRAVAAARTPIISAVGHETDTTLCDYAADMRAPTPSAAAEQAVPDRFALLQSIDERLSGMDIVLQGKVLSARRHIDSAAKQIAALSPTEKVRSMKQRTLSNRAMLDTSISNILAKKKMQLAGTVGRLEAVSPLAVIKRGYSMSMTESGKIITSTNDVNVGDSISVLVSDGAISAVVADKRYAREEQK